MRSLARNRNRNGLFNLLLGEMHPREKEVIPEVRKRRGG